MRFALIAFLFALASSFGLTPLLRALALRLGLLDHALIARKVHGMPMPRLGGVAIVVGFVGTIAVLVELEPGAVLLAGARDRTLLALVAGGLCIAALGIYDDVRGADATVKLTVQLVAATLVYALGIRIDTLSLPFVETIHLGWVGLPLTLLWLVGVVNAVNLVDGLDGLAGGLALVAIFTLSALALLTGQWQAFVALAALGGACLGFLFFNVSPASIFMGDTGSMFLGFMLAALSIVVQQRAAPTLPSAVPVLALGIPILDTLLAIVRRAARGAPIFSADREHLHHRLLALGRSHARAAGALWAAGLTLGGAAVLQAITGPGGALAVLAVGSAGTLVLLRRLGYLRMEGARRALQDRRHNLKLRAALRHFERGLLQASAPRDVWLSVRVAAPRLGARAVTLELSGKHANMKFAAPIDARGTCWLRSRHPVVSQRREHGHLELVWTDGRTSIDGRLQAAVERMCDRLMSAARRMDDVELRDPQVSAPPGWAAPHDVREPAQVTVARSAS